MPLGKYTLTYYDVLRSMLISLTHWGQVTHICIGDLTVIVSDNGLSPDRRQNITWAETGILLIGLLETNFNEILVEIQTFSFKKCIWKSRLQNDNHFVSASMHYNMNYIYAYSCRRWLMKNIYLMIYIFYNVMFKTSNMNESILRG